MNKETLLKIVNRLKEPGSRAGILAALGLLGVQVDPGVAQDAILGVVGMASLASVFMKG